MARKKKVKEQPKPLTQEQVQQALSISSEAISNGTTANDYFSNNFGSVNANANTTSTPLTDTQQQARQYIQSVMDGNSKANVPTSNNTIPKLEDNYVPGSNPNIPDEDTRMKARQYIDNVMSGKINEDGTLNKSKKSTSVQKSNPQNNNPKTPKNNKGVPSSNNIDETKSEEKKAPLLGVKNQNDLFVQTQNARVFGKNKSEGIDEKKPLSAVEQNAIYQAKHNGSLGKTNKITKEKEKVTDPYDVKGNVNNIIKGNSSKNAMPNVSIKPNMTKEEMEKEKAKVTKYEEEKKAYDKQVVENAKQGVKEFNNAVRGNNLLAKANKDVQELPTVPENAFQWSKELGKFKNDEERVNYLYKKGELNSDEEALAEKLTDNFFNQEKYGKAENRLSLLNYFESFGTGDKGVAEEIKKRFNMTDAEYEKAKSYYNLKYKADDVKAAASGFANALPFYTIGMSKSNLPSAKEEYERQSKTMESNPFSAGTGTFASKGLQYAVGNKFIGKFIGGESALANIGKGQIADTVLDTIPTIANNVVSGNYDSEDGFDYVKLGKDILENQATNLAYNLGAEGLERGIKALSKRVPNNSIPRVENNAPIVNADNLKSLENNAVDNLVNPTENVLKNADNEVIENAIKQSNDAVENIENIVKQNNVPQMAENVSQVPQNVPKAEAPKVEYNTKNVDGFTAMDSRINSMQNMFGDNVSKDKVAQMKAYLNEYATTGNEQALANARQLASELDNVLSGAKYTSKKGRTTNFGDTDTFSFEVENSANSMRNMANLRSTDMPGLDELNTKINNLVSDFGASDDVSKLATEYKQLVNNLASNPSVENLRAVQSKAEELYNALNGAEKVTNTFKGTTQKFSYDDFKDIADEPEKIFKDANNNNIRNTSTEPIVNNASSNSLQEQVDNIGDVRPINERGLEKGYVPEREFVGKSKVYNTLENNGLASMADEVDRRASMYDKHFNMETLSNALDRVNEDKQSWIDNYVSGKTKIADETDIDTTMLLIQDRMYQSKLARMSGDIEAAEKLQNEAYILKHRLRKAGTQAGQNVQAFAKWNGTSEGAILNTNRLLDDKGKTWRKRNGRKAKQVDKFVATITNKPSKDGNRLLQNSLDNLVKEDIPKVEKTFTHEEILNQVKTTLGDEFSSIGKGFEDSDYEYLANLIENGVTTKELTEMLDTKLATGVWDVDAETVQKVNDLFEQAQQFGINSKQRVDLEAEAFWELANASSKGSSIATKLDSWRYLAMLGNPKTHVRNILGNFIFGKVTDMADDLAAVMESAVDKGSRKLLGTRGGIERTKAVLTRADSKLREACKNDAINGNYRALNDGAKYKESLKSQIESQKEAFKSRPLRFLENKNSDWLDKEDFMSMRRKYSRSMASYLKANGMDESIFEIEKEYEALKKATRGKNVSKEVADRLDYLGGEVEKLNKARAYATEEAKYSAFHEDNAFAKYLSDFSRNLNESDNPLLRLSGKAFEGILPFKKTPANILRSGVEFSPVGLAKNLSYDLYQLSKGNINASQFIENISRGLTGSAIVGLGSYLYSKGIIDTVDTDTQYQNQLEGYQNYSLNIGGKTFTADFLAPSVMPLFMGVELKKSWDAFNVPTYDDNGVQVNNKNYYDYLQDALNGTSRLASPVIETSMLSGVADTLDALSNAESKTDIPGILLGNTLTSYATQMIPTVSGQVARAIDPTRRSTYVDSDKNFVGNLERQGQKIENKIPFVSMTNEPYINTRGEQQSNGIMNTGNKALDVLGNLAYQMFSPSYVADIDTRPQDVQAREVYNNMSDPDANVFEDYKTSKKIDGKPVTPEQYTTYQTEKGKSDDSIRNALATTYKKEFDSLSQENKEEVLKKINTLSDKIGTAAIVDGYTSDDKLYNAYAEGGNDGAIKYLFDEQKKKNAKSKLEEMGVPATDKNVEAMMQGKMMQIEKWQEAMERAEKNNVEPKPDGKSKLSQDEFELYNKIPIADKDKFMRYVQTAHSMDKDAGIKGWEAYKEGKYSDYLKGKKDEKEMAKDDISQKLQSLGVYSTESRKLYDKAKSVIPTLDPGEFSRQYKLIDTNRKDGISQAEMLDYLNTHNISKEDVNTLWNAYGDWKTIPALNKKGKWAAKRVKK